ncbi:hypothetical protein Goari_002779 [Gossypium aridum]|uniref:Uncharacterized protein n=1 Tax=Gossypium aridum TaxID=34290 RepID=A0A7J8YAZ0_GOSAI|nr:hypothetical protein [Gossypium aridum]
MAKIRDFVTISMDVRLVVVVQYYFILVRLEKPVCNWLWLGIGFGAFGIPGIGVNATGSGKELSFLTLGYCKTLTNELHVDTLNDAMKEEIQHLKMLTVQPMPNGGGMMNFASFGATQQYYPNNHAKQTLLAAQQFQQLQLHSQKHQHQHQHQFAPNQLHHQQEQTGEMRARGSMPSRNQKDSSSDVNSTASKD